VKSHAVSSHSKGGMSTPQKLLAATLAVLLHLPLFWHLQEKGLQRGDSNLSTASQSGVTLKLAARPAAKPTAPVPVPPSVPKAPPAPTPPPTAKPKPVLTPTPAAEEVEPQPTTTSRESSDAQEEEDSAQQQPLGGQTMGLGGASASGKMDNELERYKGLIHSRIKQLHQYPQQARMRNQQGTVEITFDVADDGSIASFSITNSSGSPLLDRAAERLFSRLKLPPPDATILPALAGLTVPVKFELEGM